MKESFHPEKLEKKEIYVVLGKIFNLEKKREEFIVRFLNLDMSRANREEKIECNYIFIGEDETKAKKVVAFAEGLKEQNKDELEIYREVKKYYKELS